MIPMTAYPIGFLTNLARHRHGAARPAIVAARAALGHVRASEDRLRDCAELCVAPWL